MAHKGSKTTKGRSGSKMSVESVLKIICVFGQKFRFIVKRIDKNGLCPNKLCQQRYRVGMNPNLNQPKVDDWYRCYGCGKTF